MIQITLTFTSLESAIQALRNLPENDVQITAGAGTKIEKAAASKDVPEAGSIVKKSAPKETAKPAEPVPTPAVVPAEPAVAYEVLQKAVFDLAALKMPDDEGTATAGRAACKALTAKFGVATFKELPEATRGEALKLVKAKTVELIREIADAKAESDLA